MGIKLQNITTPRTTPVKLIEQIDGVEREICLNVKHKRITPAVASDIAEIIAKVQREQNDYYEAITSDEVMEKKVDISKFPRNTIVAQLVYLLTYTDIEDEETGEMLPPSEEVLSQVPSGILQAILTAVSDTVIPKKSKLTNSSNGTQPEDDAAVAPIG